jgi:hypothetical protein
MTRRMKPHLPAFQPDCRRPEMRSADYRPSDHTIDHRHVLAAWLLAFAVAVIATGMPQLDAAMGETRSFIATLPGVLAAASDHRALGATADAAALAAN